jgi:transposase
MSEKRRRSQRQTIELEQLKKDPASFLSWGIEDPTLGKLETYRLYQAGYAVADIGEAFGLSPGYLYEMWGKLKAEGTVGLVDKRWGAGPRKRTPAGEAEVLRAKALNPERGDSDLAAEFGLERSTVYRLLKEHKMQDLHRVLAGSSGNELEETPPEATVEEGEKRGSKSSRVKKRCC